jgi:hypothetical protein
MLNPYWIHIEYVLNTYRIHIEYILNTYWTHTEYTLNTYWTHIEYILNTYIRTYPPTYIHTYIHILSFPLCLYLLNLRYHAPPSAQLGKLTRLPSAVGTPAAYLPTVALVASSWRSIFAGASNNSGLLSVTENVHVCAGSLELLRPRQHKLGVHNSFSPPVLANYSCAYHSPLPSCALVELVPVPRSCALPCAPHP